MNGFSRRGRGLQIKLRRNEAVVLHVMIGELIEVVNPLCQPSPNGEPTPPPSDPAMARLFPNAYRDDQDASDEFRHFTQADQAGAKVAAARAVTADIEGADDGWVSLPPENADAWAITLTNLRLMLAASLGIVDQLDADQLADLAQDDPLAPSAAIYDWCGWLLESLIECL